MTGKKMLKGHDGIIFDVTSGETLLDHGCHADLRCPLIIFESFTWVGFLCEGDDVFTVDVVVLWTR